MPAWLTFLLAGACGLITANVYYAQPLIGLISADLGMSPQTAGLIVTLTQLGFAAGMILIVPLADLLENRRLIVGMIGVSVIALAAAALTTHPQAFLIAALFIGLSFGLRADPGAVCIASCTRNPCAAEPWAIS